MPIHLAAASGPCSLVEYLVGPGNANVNARVTAVLPLAEERHAPSWTPLFFAKSPAIVDILMEAGARVNHRDAVRV